MPEESPRSEWSEADRVLVEHLERRRGELAVAQWQAPGLTIAAQAFLLQVLANDKIEASARAVVLAAGAVASFAALISLLRLRQRDVRYSEVIALYGVEVRPQMLPQGKKIPRKGFWPWVDGSLRTLAGWDRWPGTHLWWVLALILFIAADIVVYCATT